MIPFGTTHEPAAEVGPDMLLPPAWIRLVADDGTIVVDVGNGPVLADVARHTPGGPILVTPRNPTKEARS